MLKLPPPDYRLEGVRGKETHGAQTAAMLEGIEQISDIEDMADITCVGCHRGNGDATEADEAHAGMFANPSDLRVAAQTCGTCHPDVVDDITKSLHAITREPPG